MSAQHTVKPWTAPPKLQRPDWEPQERGGCVDLGYTIIHRITCDDANRIAATLELLEAVQYQLNLMQWIETADTESPFYEETMRLRLNTGRDLMQSAIAKATGKESK
jgi:hypothetical protein